MLSKKYGSGERGYKKTFAGGGLMFNRGLEMFQKREASQESGGEKIKGGCDPQKKLMTGLPKAFKFQNQGETMRFDEEFSNFR